MFTEDNEFDDILSDVSMADFGVDRSNNGADGSTEIRSKGWSEPNYEGKIDYRIRQLSYSSLLSLHSCPRAYQLYKLKSSSGTEELLKSSITFAFGHVVGEGIALALSGNSEQEIIWKMFCGWHTQSIFDRDDTSAKSFFEAIIAVKRFIALRPVLLKDWEIVYYQGVPACELSFCINFPDGFRLRGFVDAVLRHRISGEVMVLECKTTKYKAVNPASYKNSAQAIGYSVVLDHLFASLSSYSVLYLVYSTTTGEFFPIPFQKSYLQRAQWIREVLLDIEMIKMYDAAEVYPMHGESCVAFGRDCVYLNSCTMSTSSQTKPCTKKEEDKTDYQVNITLADLLQSQLEKLGS